MDVQFIFSLILGLAVFVVGAIIVIFSCREKEWGKVWCGIALVCCGIVIWIGSVAGVNVGFKSASLLDVEHLWSEHVYVLEKDQEFFQPRNTDEEKYAEEYLTWLKRDDEEKPKAFRFSEKLTCKKFVVFRNEHGKMEIRSRDEPVGEVFEKEEFIPAPSIPPGV